MRMNLIGVVGEIDTLPGCSQVAVSHGVFLAEKERGAGKGTEANCLRRKAVFDDLGYDCMICTVNSANAAQKAVLRTNGWDFLTQFVSRKTGHVVEMWACYSSEGL